VSGGNHKVAKTKVGRNDPCPCGSGKKYKNCCYRDKTKAWKTAGPHESSSFTVKPKEVPKPIMNHEVSSNGKTWESRPGLLAVQLHTRDPKDIDAAIDKIARSTVNKINALTLCDATKRDLIDCIHDIDHKLHAVRYHLDNYEQAEGAKVGEFGHNYKPPAGAQMIKEEPALIYEVEAFLFQVKSCLDILAGVLKPALGFNYCSFGDKGDDVIRQLRNNCPASLRAHAEKIAKLVEDAQDAWLVEVIKMRDEVTHYSRLEGFSCFIQDPYLGGCIATIHYPTMPNKQTVRHYCQNAWQLLLSFCGSFLDLAVEAAKTPR
jgi:hypothetical protein